MIVIIFREFSADIYYYYYYYYSYSCYGNNYYVLKMIKHLKQHIRHSRKPPIKTLKYT